ncbi:hypothetical protein EGW08_016955 [Elysia chlorotica]|uniref:MADF domain-containing protein n=1 Tax=Elysia chlorotica TaxID=188477 RepID=A0A433T173_ELYCH|nr:hypothetical protein EGW08_016955 [Elysia chlorotica]
MYSADFTMAWSREGTRNFLALYREEECLWKVKSKLYNDKNAREKANGKLAAFCRQFETDANIDTVRRKINNLRCAFRKELKRQQQENSKLSASGSDEVYEPKLWYFNELLFLQDQETPRASR